MTLKVNVDLDVETPSVPWFLRALRQGKDAGTIPIGDLSNKQLRKIVDVWAAALMANAEKQRKEKAAA